ncbi:response regulator transcription factor [Leucobacter sp. USCH14]|uniref:response regulator transcription factor n=1 Tax=Leucobacter sp. USCH14 TaxID=3024838 RepID=UPI00309DD4B1
MRVLVTEDDASVSAALAAALTRAGHTCDRVASGGALLQQHRDADLVLLDLGLEDMDGLTALEQLREVSEIPVIVVTARGDERSTVRALRLGADDYLVKPVRLHELLARLAAVARRYTGLVSDRIELGDVVIDETERLVRYRGASIGLTPTECSLLAVLGRHAGNVVSRQHLLDAVWGETYSATSRAFDVHLAGLRQKVPMLSITTIRGRGFRLERPR